jgi:hypothetical protein
MSLAFDVSGLVVSGSDVQVLAKTMNAVGPCRLYVKNTGANALTAAKVQLGPDADNLYDFDTTTFASLAAGAMLSLVLAAPVSALKLLATCAGGTMLDIWMSDAVGVN